MKLVPMRMCMQAICPPPPPLLQHPAFVGLHRMLLEYRGEQEASSRPIAALITYVQSMALCSSAVPQEEHTCGLAMQLANLLFTLSERAASVLELLKAETTA